MSCEWCGKDDTHGGGMDDAFDCFCSRCRTCGHVEQDCQCVDREYPDDYGEDYGG